MTASTSIAQVPALNNGDKIIETLPNYSDNIDAPDLVIELTVTGIENGKYLTAYKDGTPSRPVDIGLKGYGWRKG